MRRYFIAMVLLLISASVESQVAVSGTITDANKNPYANGTVHPYYLNASGQQVFSPIVPTNSAGTFSTTLGPNNWAFIVCAPPVPPPPGTQPPPNICFTSVFIPISGLSQDVSAAVSANAALLGPGGGAGQVGPGTQSFYALFNNAAGTTVGNGNLDDGITAPSTITSTETLATPQVNLTGTGGGLISSPGGVLPALGAGNGGFGVTTGALPEINVNNAWFLAPYLTVAGTALSQNQANFNNTTPAAPANGINIQFQNSGTGITAAIVGDGNAAHALCGNGTFASCVASGSTPLSGLTAATGPNTISNGNNPQTWQSSLTTASTNFLNLTESLAGTATTAFLLNVATLAGSTVQPAQFGNSLTGAQTLASVVINPTWNTSGAATALLVNPTNTASAVGSLLGSFQVGGVHFVDIDRSGDILSGGAIGSNANASPFTVCGGSASSGCAGLSNNGVTGGLTSLGGDNSNTGAGARGGFGIFRGGMLTAAAPNAAAIEGVSQLASGYLKGAAIAAAGDVVCATTTAFTVTDCASTPATNVIGIATNTSNPIGVVSYGLVLVSLDGALTAIGDNVCLSTTTAGKGHDNGSTTTACPLGQSIGVIVADVGTVTQMSGASTAATAMSTTLPLVQLHISQ